MTHAHRSGKVGARFLLLALVAAASALTSLAPEASAYSVAVERGNPGAVAFGPIRGYHLPVTQMIFMGGSTFVPVTTFHPALNHVTTRACRSSRTAGAQTLTVRYVVARWDGSSWAGYSTMPTLTARIPAGYACVASPFALTLGANAGAYLSAGHFKVHAAFIWSDPRGNVLGLRYYVFDAQGDYRCDTAVRACQTGAGWVYLG